MRKNTLLFTIFITLIIGGTASAQSFTIGFKGGLNIPNLTNGNSNNPLSSGYSSRLASDFAVFAEFRVSDLFSVQPMVEYSEQGGKKNSMQAFVTPPELTQLIQQQYVYANYKSTAHLNYLLVPVLAKFGWNLSRTAPLRFYVDVGPFGGYLVSAKQVTRGSSLIYMDPNGQNPVSSTAQSFNSDNKIRNQLHKFNVGVEGFIGLSYGFQRSRIFIEGGGNFGFIDIQKNPENGTNHTGAATISLGYAYVL